MLKHIGSDKNIIHVKEYRVLEENQAIRIRRKYRLLIILSDTKFPYQFESKNCVA